MNRKKPDPPKKALDGRGLKIGLIVSEFNSHITRKMLDGAILCLEEHGVRKSDIGTYRCPGAFELPQVASKLVKVNRWDALVCLGAVIRGETPHFEYVSTEAARGIQNVALSSGTSVAFGLLTTDNEKQALERAGGKCGNKGWDAALSALEMALLFKEISNPKKGK